MKLSRISKLFVDRDATTTQEALERRKRYRITFVCGDDIANSYTSQLALLTAARIAGRCFPGAVHVALSASLRESPLRLWPGLTRKPTIAEVLAEALGEDALKERSNQHLDECSIVLGDVPAPASALRMTFDGWIAKVGPVRQTERLPEREHLPLAGMLAGALAVSEHFLSLAEVSLEARRREIGFSLWRPDLNITDANALGVAAEFAPSALWALGLGHLGNAYLWALAGLPYVKPSDVEISLFDFDKVEDENSETGLIFSERDVGQYKTRVCGDWLEGRGFKTKIVERRFDATYRCQEDEARLALCGFDSNAPRRDLGSAGYEFVVESGLGGTAANFDTIALHMLPNERSVQELWPEPVEIERAKQIAAEERMARENAGYAELDEDECGRALLAGKAVAVPFVGVTAACFALSEVIRLAHEGPRYTDMRLRLGSPQASSAQLVGKYASSDLAGLKFVPIVNHAG